MVHGEDLVCDVPEVAVDHVDRVPSAEAELLFGDVPLEEAVDLIIIELNQEGAVEVGIIAEVCRRCIFVPRARLDLWVRERSVACEAFLYSAFWSREVVEAHDERTVGLTVGRVPLVDIARRGHVAHNAGEVRLAGLVSTADGAIPLEEVEEGVGAVLGDTICHLADGMCGDVVFLYQLGKLVVDFRHACVQTFEVMKKTDLSRRSQLPSHAVENERHDLLVCGGANVLLDDVKDPDASVRFLEVERVEAPVVSRLEQEI